MIYELNHCLEVPEANVNGGPGVQPRSELFLLPQEILRANASVKTAADLATKYRKNVQYNLEATRGNDSEETSKRED